MTPFKQTIQSIISDVIVVGRDEQEEFARKVWNAALDAAKKTLELRISMTVLGNDCLYVNELNVLDDLKEGATYN